MKKGKFEDDSICLPVFDDESILMDMDTREDYTKPPGYFNTAAPNRMECYAIQKLYNMPENIIAHCLKVSEVSINILGSLESSGYKLNKEALEAAALLHDIARKEKNHALAGEKILKEIGYEYVGYIISTHMDIDVDENGKVTENEILYLSDKLVKDDKIIPIKERMKQCIDAYRYDAEAQRKILCRFENAEKIIKKIEKITGKGFTYG